MNVLNIDGATRVDIVGVYVGFKWQPIIFEHFNVDQVGDTIPDDAEPFEITKDYTFTVSKDVNESDIRIQIACTQDDNKITVDNADSVILKPGQYYYSIANADDPFPLYYGLLTINHKKEKWS